MVDREGDVSLGEFLGEWFEWMVFMNGSCVLGVLGVGMLVGQGRICAGGGCCARWICARAVVWLA